MRASYLWITGCSLLGLFVACSSGGGLGTGNGNGNGNGGDDSNGSSSGTNLGGGGSGGAGSFHVEIPDALPEATMYESSACKAGFYEGMFTGNYSSHLTLFGIDIPVSGNVQLTLNQKGSSAQQCTVMIEGEGLTTESCSNLFELSGGVITGVADKVATGGDGGLGGFPYYCSMTGTLDCNGLILDDGWIECTYCLGPLNDPDSGPLGTCALAGGNFSGPLKATYDTSTLAFTNGNWNGAEVLCGGIAGTSTAYCNDGGEPGPEGGAATKYLVADGGYGLAPNFGGAGSWGATCVDCK